MNSPLLQKPFAEMEFHPVSEKLVEIICKHVGNTSPGFFRIIVAYYMALVASMMRCSIITTKGDVPVGMYAFNLAPSGTGKGQSIGLIDKEITHLFKNRFMTETFPFISKKRLAQLALMRANRDRVDLDISEKNVQAEFIGAGGKMAYAFSAGTVPALKQLRHLLLMSGLGSINYRVDEIGQQLIGQTELLDAFLELYDSGEILEKIIKVSAASARYEEQVGMCPTNMLLFGAPVAVFDDGPKEALLYSMLNMGYARRCFVGYNTLADKVMNKTPKERYAESIDPVSRAFKDSLADDLEKLADEANLNVRLTMSEETHLRLYEYQYDCEMRALAMSENEEIKKLDMVHRHSKVLKLAGAYAFIDHSGELTADHLYMAIKLAEESGEALNSMLTRDQPHIRLAKYIANSKEKVTKADFVTNLLYYRGSVQAKQELMDHAVAWGYQNNVVIKTHREGTVDFFSGEALKPTDVNQLIVSWTKEHYGANDYTGHRIRFDQLAELTQQPGYHWINHHLDEKDPGHRLKTNCVPGFNLIVIDVDGGINAETAVLLLKDYRFHLYTTKRHTDSEHRFRIVLPINYELKMDERDYKEFMTQILEWMPFASDPSTDQREKKWFTHPGQHYDNDGILFDALRFIPKTKKNEDHRQVITSQASMDNVERWIFGHITAGNRNNMLARFAFSLVDGGYDINTIQSKVMALNARLEDPLGEGELMRSVMSTVAKKMQAITEAAAA